VAKLTMIVVVHLMSAVAPAALVTARIEPASGVVKKPADQTGGRISGCGRTTLP
jgi:hypothetical protein